MPGTKKSAAMVWCSPPPCWQPSAFDENSRRVILGVSTALSEAEVHWRGALTSLQERGLNAFFPLSATIYSPSDGAHSPVR